MELPNILLTIISTNVQFSDHGLWPIVEIVQNEIEQAILEHPLHFSPEPLFYLIVMPLYISMFFFVYLYFSSCIGLSADAISL